MSAVAYVYSEDRTYDRPKPQLAGFSGVLQVDGWGGFKRLTGDKVSVAGGRHCVADRYARG
jgi:hypothetical protein